MNDDEREKLFLEQVRNELDAGLAGLDEDALARLRQSRLRALEESGRSRWWWLAVPRWATAGGLATAVMLAVAVSVWFNASKEGLPVRQTEDLEILTVQENLDISKDLDFYHWLACADNER